MSYGLYIHIPYCRRKCPYCAFSSVTGADESDYRRYFESLKIEYSARSAAAPFSSPPSTIYIGGGTPSLIPADIVCTFLSPLITTYLTECTIEANPDSFTDSWASLMIDYGVTRLSIGVQSLDDTILATLGRLHDAASARKAAETARKSGIQSLSIDIMFGVPGQSLSQWRDTVKGVLELGPDHISAYSLNVEEDSVFYEMKHAGGLHLPDEEETADMYSCLNELAQEYGISRYEISNFSRPGHECRHNIGYWNRSPYIGIGASAHTFDGAKRTWNSKDPELYIETVSTSLGFASDGSEIITDRTAMIETVMLSLRTSRGLSPVSLKQLHQYSNGSTEPIIESFTTMGLVITQHDGALVLTQQGAVLSDEIIEDILSEI